MITTLVFFLFISVSLLASFAAIALRETAASRVDVRAKQSWFLAEAGMEDALYRIRANLALSPSETIGLDGSSATVIVTQPDSDTYALVSTGDVSSAIRRAAINLRRGIGVSFPYGAQVGYLGLKMENESKVIGSVYSNGNIEGNNRPEITGDAWVAGGTAQSPDQAQLTQTADLFLRDQPEREDAAQSFVPSITAEIRKVSLYLKKVGNPGDIVLRILADNGGVPRRSGPQATGHIGSSRVTSSYSWVEATLNSNEPLLAGQRYWIVLDTGASDPAKYYFLGGAADASYPSGTFLYSPDWNAGSPTWTPTDQDAAFQAFMGTVDTFLDGIRVGENGIGDAHAHEIKNSTIAGDAYYQVISNTTVGGASFPGSQDPPPQALPLSQGEIDQFKANGDAGGVCGFAQGCDGLGNFELEGRATTTLGPIKIPGNMRLENQAGLIMTGTIHVTGNFKFKNRCRVELHPSYGGQSGVIVVEGTVDIENQCDLFGSGNPSSHLMVLTTSPALAGPPALRVENTATGAIFYASAGTLVIENRANLKAAVAQGLRLKNQATVIYETGLANVRFSAGPTGGWDIQRWGEVP